MPRNRKSDIVDGFNVYKAAQRAAQDTKSPAPGAPPPEPVPEGTPKKIGAHIGRTVLPTKHDVTCYECEYEFQMTGAATSTFCSKCRTNLTVENHVIKGAWSGELKTAGTVHIMPDGIIESGIIMANHILVEGSVGEGELRAFRWLELRPGAVYNPDKMTSRDLRIATDMQVILPIVEKHHVEVSGTLRARVVTTGTVHVMEGGLVEGRIESEHLVVDDGGGLRAELAIRPARAAAHSDDPTLEQSA